ncbi:MAG TPA: hypothetical protein VLY63_05845, partial [Anaerolineae bacterium]|nr:hypothetical protein [Anaerolineae bacterium]
LGTTGIGLLGILWVFGYVRGWGWMAYVGLVGFVAAAAIGLLLNLGVGWMVFGLVAALCAWDLHRFVLCLERVDRVVDERTMTNRHLGRLLAVAGLGLVLAVVALRIQVRLTFLMALLLGLMAVWGLSRAVGFLRRESD